MRRHPVTLPAALTSLLATSFLAAGPLAAHDCPPLPGADVPPGAVVLFDDVGWRGSGQSFTADAADLAGGALGNDRASSLRVDAGCRVVLYSDAGYGGRATVLESDVYDLGRTRVGNDAVSSLSVHCIDLFAGPSGTEGVTLYADRGYAGRHELLVGSDPRLADNPVGNDAASSIRVPRGCEAVLWDDEDYRGRSTILRDDLADLGEARVGNDTVSSIQVRCGVLWP